MVASTSMCSQPSWAGAAPAAQARSRACARAARIRGSRRRRCAHRPAATVWSSRGPARTRARDPPTTDRPHRRSPRRRPPRRPDRRTHPRRMRPRPPVRVRQRGCDLPRQPAQIGHLAQHAHPGVRHDAMAVRRHFHPTNRYATLHLESAFPLGIMDSRQASSFLAGQALSPTQAPCHAEFREKSRLTLSWSLTLRWSE